MASRKSPKPTTRRKPPRKYSATVHKKIVKAIRNGAYKTHAFQAAGIHRATGAEWVKLGHDRPDEYPQYAQLADDIEEAEGAIAVEMTGRVVKDARSRRYGAWVPAMTYLERRHPGLFGKRDTTVIEGGESPIQVMSHVLINDPDTRRASLDLLRRAAGARAGEPGGVRLGDGDETEPGS